MEVLVCSTLLKKYFVRLICTLKKISTMRVHLGKPANQLKTLFLASIGYLVIREDIFTHHYLDLQKS